MSAIRQPAAVLVRSSVTVVGSFSPDGVKRAVPVARSAATPASTLSSILVGDQSCPPMKGSKSSFPTSLRFADVLRHRLHEVASGLLLRADVERLVRLLIGRVYALQECLGARCLREAPGC